MALHVDVHHSYFDDLAGLDVLVGIFDELVRQRGNMDEAVLMYADVDKSAEGGAVAAAT